MAREENKWPQNNRSNDSNLDLNRANNNANNQDHDILQLEVGDLNWAEKKYTFTGKELWRRGFIVGSEHNGEGQDDTLHLIQLGLKQTGQVNLYQFLTSDDQDSEELHEYYFS